ncbi:MAG: hypothetical protein IIU40_10455, partial [Lachnospiraceae bacterium]|nr:hypothetical protein [Lachnospiraceae bacterium]
MATYTRGVADLLEGTKTKLLDTRKTTPNNRIFEKYAGGGVISSGAKDEVIKFAEKCNLPIVTTMMGIGVISADHPLSMGMVGNNGKKYANRAMNESDVLIMVGARVADRAVSQPDLITKDKTLIHIDIDPAEIGKNAGPSIPIVGDAAAIFKELNKEEIN